MSDEQTGAHWLWLVVMAGGAAAAVLGAGVAGLLVLMLLLAGSPLAATDALPVASVAALAVGLGGLLVCQGWRGWRAREMRRFPSRHYRWWWGAFALAVGVGLVGEHINGPAGLLLLPAHIVAMSLPPLLLLAITARALRPAVSSWREIIAGLGGGGFVGMPLALVTEASLLICLGVLVGALILALPGGVDALAAILRELRESAILGDTQRVLELALRPSVVAGLVLVVGIGGPVIEEVLKTLAIGVAGTWMRPAPSRAFLWGAAGGAGFAIAENLLNGSVLGQNAWLATVVSRTAATAMHCLTGGLVGWGWASLWSGGRFWRFATRLASAVALHAVWNLLAFGLALLQLSATARTEAGAWSEMSEAAVAIGAPLLGVLALGASIALPLLARRIAAREQLSIASETDCEPGEGAVAHARARTPQ